MHYNYIKLTEYSYLIIYYLLLRLSIPGPDFPYRIGSRSLTTGVNGAERVTDMPPASAKSQKWAKRRSV